MRRQKQERMGMRVHGKGYEGAIPGRSARSRYAAMYMQMNSHDKPVPRPPMQP